MVSANGRLREVTRKRRLALKRYWTPDPLSLTSPPSVSRQQESMPIACYSWSLNPPFVLLSTRRGVRRQHTPFLGTDSSVLLSHKAPLILAAGTTSCKVTAGRAEAGCAAWAGGWTRVTCAVDCSPSRGSVTLATLWGCVGWH